MKDLILFGDNRQTLTQFDEKARCCITSPPYYGLRDYGGEDSQIGMEQSPEEYVSIRITSRWMVFTSGHNLE